METTSSHARRIEVYLTSFLWSFFIQELCLEVQIFRAWNLSSLVARIFERYQKAITHIKHKVLMKPPSYHDIRPCTNQIRREKLWKFGSHRAAQLLRLVLYALAASVHGFYFTTTIMSLTATVHNHNYALSALLSQRSSVQPRETRLALRPFRSDTV